MSIFAAVRLDSAGGIVLAAGAALIIALAVMVVRRSSVTGAARVDPEEPLSPLFALTLLGFGVWMMVPSFYAAAMGVEETATPAPATERSGIVFTPQQQVALSIASGTVVFVILVVGHALTRPGGLTRLGFSPRSLARGAVAGLLACLLVLPLTFIAAVATELLWRWVGLKHPGVHDMLQILGETDRPRLRLMVYLSAILVAPLAEEVMFRGHLQTLLVAAYSRARVQTGQSTESRGRWLAIVVTSILFSLVHGAVWMMPPIFFLSVCLGYVYERTANLWAPILIHLLFNAINVVFFVSFAGR